MARCRACSIIGVVAALLSLGAAGMYLVILAHTVYSIARYSPMYQPVSCQEGGIGELQIHDLGHHGHVHITVPRTRRCRNSNNYALKLSELDLGQVFVLAGNGTLVQVGRSVVASSVLPANGEAGSDSRVNVSISNEAVVALLLPHASEPRARIVTVIQLGARGELTSLVFGYRFFEVIDDICGFELDLVSRRVGPSACAGSLKELAVPAFQAPPGGFHFLSAKPGSAEAKARKMHLLFGSVCVLSGLGVCPFFAFGWRRLRQSLAQIRDERADQHHEAGHP